MKLGKGFSRESGELELWQPFWLDGGGVLSAEGAPQKTCFWV